MKVLVLGASGLIGNGLFTGLSNKKGLEVYGSIRKSNPIQPAENGKLLRLRDVIDRSEMMRLLTRVRPDAVINCIGLTKNLCTPQNSAKAIELNSLLPHTLSDLGTEFGFRLIHISSDCVFSGTKGNYSEDSAPDAQDLYGRTKTLGEVVAQQHLTLRTSTIGPELLSSHGLLEWFLAQKQCDGYANAYFSGLSTYEFSNILYDYILFNKSLGGLLNVGAEKISKYDLLKIINEVYSSGCVISKTDDFALDRSLNSKKFSDLTGYRSPSWEKIVKEMWQNSRNGAMFNV